GRASEEKRLVRGAVGFLAVRQAVVRARRDPQRAPALLRVCSAGEEAKGGGRTSERGLELSQPRLDGAEARRRDSDQPLLTALASDSDGLLRSLCRLRKLARERWHVRKGDQSARVKIVASASLANRAHGLG